MNFVDKSPPRKYVCHGCADALEEIFIGYWCGLERVCAYCNEPIELGQVFQIKLQSKKTINERIN